MSDEAYGCVAKVGYIACNMKQSSEGLSMSSPGMNRYANSHDMPSAHIGDTYFRVGQPVEPLAGFKASKAMVCGTWM